jgi:hypothetical protein
MQTHASAIASTPAVSGQAATVARSSTAPRQRTVSPSNRHRQAKLQLADTLLERISGPTLDSATRDIGPSATEQTNSLQRVVSRSLASPGRPLDPKVRHVMEQRFDYDFSKVRLHDNRRAATMGALPPLLSAGTSDYNNQFSSKRPVAVARWPMNSRMSASRVVRSRAIRDR